jgi:hypothetical protein
LNVPGLKTKIFFGTWRSMFGWYKEELDLYYVNYLHFGKPKIWYTIIEEHNEKFEKLINDTF